MRSVYGSVIDQEYFSLFESEVLKAVFVRRNFRFYMKLKMLDDFDDFSDQTAVELYGKIHIRDKNVSLKNSNYSIPLVIEKSWNDLKEKYKFDNELLSVRYKLENDTDYKSVDINKIDLIKLDSNDFKNYAFETEVPKGLCLDLIMEFKMIKFARDHNTIQSLIPCSILEVEIEHDERLEIFHNSLQIADFRIESPTHRSGFVRLVSNGPLLPSHGIELWWRPRINKI
jgi:hypothetical protein